MEELTEKITNIVSDEIDKAMQTLTIQDCSDEELLLLKKFWEYKYEHAVMKIDLIDEEINKRKPINP